MLEIAIALIVSDSDAAFASGFPADGDQPLRQTIKHHLTYVKLAVLGKPLLSSQRSVAKRVRTALAGRAPSAAVARHSQLDWYEGGLP